MIKDNKQGNSKGRTTQTQKSGEEYIHFTDDFMFSRVMGNSELCKEFLETILGEKIDGVIKHEAQKFLGAERDTKSVRLDVYAETAITMINTEMQKSKEDQIGKRSRYSGSLMDGNQLKRGGEYKDLKRRYVIFICTKDPFERGLCQYTFKSVCKEDESVDLDNGVIDIVINLRGDLSNTQEDYKELLEYMGERKSPRDCKNVLVQKIHSEVERANLDPELRRIHMTVGERYEQIERDSLREGIEQGLQQGEATIIIKMSDGGMSQEAIAEILELPMEHIESILNERDI